MLIRGSSSTLSGSFEISQRNKTILCIETWVEIDFKTKFTCNCNFETEGHSGEIKQYEQKEEEKWISANITSATNDM